MEVVGLGVLLPFVQFALVGVAVLAVGVDGGSDRWSLGGLPPDRGVLRLEEREDGRSRLMRPSGRLLSRGD